MSRAQNGARKGEQKPRLLAPAAEPGTGRKGQGRLLSAQATRDSSRAAGPGTEGISVCLSVITLGRCSMAVERCQSALTMYGATGPSEAVQQDLHRSVAAPGPLADRHSTHSLLWYPTSSSFSIKQDKTSPSSTDRGPFSCSTALCLKGQGFQLPTPRSDASKQDRLSSTASASQTSRSAGPSARRVQPAPPRCRHFSANDIR